MYPKPNRETLSVFGWCSRSANSVSWTQNAITYSVSWTLQVSCSKFLWFNWVNLKNWLTRALYYSQLVQGEVWCINKAMEWQKFKFELLASHYRFMNSIIIVTTLNHKPTSKLINWWPDPLWVLKSTSMHARAMRVFTLQSDFGENKSWKWWRNETNVHCACTQN